MSMRLTTNELHSPLWDKLQTHLNERITALQRQLEADVDQNKTTNLRGRITAFRELLALANPATPESP